MKNLSIATAGATFILGAVAMAPAQAANLTKLDYSGTTNVSLFNVVNIPFNVNESITVDNLSGRLSDAEDSGLTIDNPLSYLGSDFNNLFNSVGGSLDSLAGSGSVSKNNVFLSAFNFLYDKSSDILTVKDYNFDNLKACLSGTCNILGQGAFSGSILGGSLPFFGSLSFDINQTATPIAESVPEPSTFIGLVGLGGFLAAKRKQKKAA